MQLQDHARQVLQQLLKHDACTDWPLVTYQHNSGDPIPPGFAIVCWEMLQVFRKHMCRKWQPKSFQKLCILEDTASSVQKPTRTAGKRPLVLVAADPQSRACKLLIAYL